jgi:hypothetical protein
MQEARPTFRRGALAALLATAACAAAQAQAPLPAADRADAASIAATTLGRSLAVGDIVFIRIGAYPFRKVAEATGSWTNHVGVVLDVSGPEPLVGESRFPFSGTTPLSRFVARSAGGRVAVMRLPEPLTPAQRAGVAAAAARRAGVLYDTGFDLHSRRQFCSRYVREVLHEGAGADVGRVEDFRSLLVQAPDADLGFWRAWYFGNIPWQRETVTPASVLRTPGLATVFDGVSS